MFLQILLRLLAAIILATDTVRANKFIPLANPDQRCRAACREMADECRRFPKTPVNPGKETDSDQCILSPLGAMPFKYFPQIGFAKPLPNAQRRPGLIFVTLQVEGMKLGSFTDPKKSGRFLLEPHGFDPDPAKLGHHGYIKLTAQHLGPSQLMTGEVDTAFPDPEKLDSIFLSKGRKTRTGIDPRNRGNNHIFLPIRVRKLGWYRICAEGMTPDHRSMGRVDHHHVRPLSHKVMDCVRIEIVNRVTRDMMAWPPTKRFVRDMPKTIEDIILQKPGSLIVQ